MSRIRSLRRDIVPENAFYGSGTSVWVEFQVEPKNFFDKKCLYGPPQGVYQVSSL